MAIVPLKYYNKKMKELMTKQFSKWVSKQKIPAGELATALKELQNGKFEANLGGNIYKKEFDLKEKVRVTVLEQLSATTKKIEPSLFMDLLKIRNQIYQKNK